MLPGDGIGPEVTEQAVRVLAVVAPDLEFERGRIGGSAIDQDGEPLPAETLERARACGLVLLGAVGGPRWDDLPPNRRPERGLLEIRRELGLYANLRPVVVTPTLLDASPLRREVIEGVDLLVVRELTGGIYFGEPRGEYLIEGVRAARNTMVYEEHEVARIARVAFESARGRRRRVTNIHKANVLEVCAFWNEVVIEVARDYPDVELDHLLVDAAAMILLRDAARFDVILAPNMFGDILSDEASMLAGSLGMLPSASLGDEGRGLFEPVHGSAPDIAGRDQANPLAAILCAAMLLDHGLGRPEDARRVEAAVEKVLAAGYRSPDLGGGPGTREVGTREIGERVCEALA